MQEDYYIPKLKDKIVIILIIMLNIAYPVFCLKKKKGKKEGLLRSIPKDDVPLNTYHIDHLGPMTSTSKLYEYLLVIIDGFSKFIGFIL